MDALAPPRCAGPSAETTTKQRQNVRGGDLIGIWCRQVDPSESVKVFKTNAVGRARPEAEQKQGEARAAGRRTDMLRLADEFEAAVGVAEGARLGEVAGRREQPPQCRGRDLPRHVRARLAGPAEIAGLMGALPGLICVNVLHTAAHHR